MSTLLLVDDPLFEQHRGPSNHPERPPRLEAARRATASRAAAHGAVFQAVSPRDATDDELARTHAAAYIEHLARLAGTQASIDVDTYISPSSVAAARRAAGGSLALVDAILSGGVGAPTRGVALLRPPGHHATPSTGMGFCLLNNVAIAAHHALASGLKRVAIIDFDVHHGNGTQDIFFGDERVLFVSIHQAPFYPGTGDADEVGAGDGRGYTINVPLEGGAHDAVYAAAFQEIVEPALGRFEPQLVLISAGYDAHMRDPLGGMHLTDQAFGAMTQSLVRSAEQTADGRVGLFLEGGYDLAAIEASLGASIDALLGVFRASEAAPKPISTSHRRQLDQVRSIAHERFPDV